MDKNFKAKAISKNPKDTFTVFNQPPEEGIEFNQPGKMAKSVKGMAIANEKPNIAKNGPKPPCSAAITNCVPIIGPVQENETNPSVAAMKKIPIKPPRSAFLSAAFTQELGNVISNAPKNEMPKTISMAKKIMLNQTLVANSFNELAPNAPVIINPMVT